MKGKPSTEFWPLDRLLVKRINILMNIGKKLKLKFIVFRAKAMLSAVLLLGFLLAPCVWGDGAGVVQFSSSAYSVDETEESITITVNRERGVIGDVSVDYSIAYGSASQADIIAADGTLTWANGELGPKTFSIDIVNDVDLEPDEDVFLRLKNPQGDLQIGALGESVLYIAGHESGEFGFAADGFITSETDRIATIVVTRGLGATGAVAVDYEVRSGTSLSENEIGGVRFWRK